MTIDKQTSRSVKYLSMNQTSCISNKPTSKGEQTRQRIVETAAQLIHRQGYHNTGLQQILDEANVTKGAFYFHFKDKKSLALAVIDFFQDYFRLYLAAPLTDSNKSALERLAGFHQSVMAAFTGPVGMVGCPMGNMTLELAAAEPEIAAQLESRFEHLSELFKDVIESGQQSGEIQSSAPAKQLADFVLNSWEGAVLRMKASRNTAALDNWFKSLQLTLRIHQG